MLNRVLTDHTIYGFFEGGFFGLIAGAIVWRKHIKKVGHIYSLPPQAQLLAAGGICVGEARLFCFLALFSALYLLAKLMRRKQLLAVPFGIAVIVSVMYL
jgi:hypothetical protein